jgi:hypothetical protein
MHGGPWPEWIPLAEVAGRVEALAKEYSTLPPEAFTEKGQEFGEALAGYGGAHLTDDVRSDDRKGKEQLARSITALCNGLALGSLCPGGVKLWGVWFETVGETTHMRALMHAQG